MIFMKYHYLVGFEVDFSNSLVKYATTCQNLEWVNQGLHTRVEYLGSLDIGNKNLKDMIRNTIGYIDSSIDLKDLEEMNLEKELQYIWKCDDRNQYGPTEYLLFTDVDRPVTSRSTLNSLLRLFIKNAKINLPFTELIDLDEDEDEDILRAFGMLARSYTINEDWFGYIDGKELQLPEDIFIVIKKLYYDFFSEKRLCKSLKESFDAYLERTLPHDSKLTLEDQEELLRVFEVGLNSDNRHFCFPRFRLHGNEFIFGKYLDFNSEMIISEWFNSAGLKTQILDYAFSHCDNLKKASILTDITHFGDAVFSNCFSLEEVVFSNNMHTLPNRTFERCSYLKNVTLPQTVKVIGKDAFDSCSALINANILKELQVVIIGDGAFNNCGQLLTIHLPKTLKTIGAGAFSFSGLTSISIPESVVTIGPEAFFHAQLSTVKLPNTLLDIPNSCFSYCPLEEIELPVSLIKIGEKAFEGCSRLKRVVIPDGVVEIGDDAFLYCDRLEEINFPSSLVSLGKCEFDKKTVVHCKENSLVHKMAREKNWNFNLV